MAILRCKIVAAMTLFGLAFSGDHVPEIATTRSASGAVSQDEALAEETDARFPDGLTHDFGKVVRGTECNHVFRIVNTADVPLHILSLRAT